MNTHTTKTTKFYLKVHGKSNSSRMQIMVLSGLVRVKSKAPSTFATLFGIRTKYSYNSMINTNIHNCMMSENNVTCT